MSQLSNASIGAPEALNTIAEIKSFLKGTTDVQVEPFQFIVLGLFFYIYPVFESLTYVLRSSYDANLVMNDIWAYERWLSWTSEVNFTDSQYYLAHFAREALYAIILFAVMHWVGRKFFGKEVVLSPIAKKVRNGINGIVLFGFLAGYAVAYLGTDYHVLPMMVIGSGVCFYIIGQFTRPMIRYLGVVLGVFGLIVLLSFGSHNSFMYNIMYFFTSSALLGTGLLMMIENRLTARTA